MEIVTLSDTHVGQKGWGTRGLVALHKVAAMDPFKILILNGDIGETFEGFDLALEIIKTIPAEYKLFVCGNNDVDKIGGVCFDYAQTLQDKVRFAGIHVLDLAPIIIDGVAFVGNLGWYDGTLWKPVDPDVSSEYPTTLEAIHKRAFYWFRTNDAKEGDPITSSEFFHYLRGTLKEHLDVVLPNEDVKRVVVLSHCVTSPEFVLYGASTFFDYTSWYMGYDANLPQHSWMYDDPKIVLGIVGHVHYSKKVMVGCTPVHNVAGKDQPLILKIPEIYI